MRIGNRKTTRVMLGKKIELLKCDEFMVIKHKDVKSVFLWGEDNNIIELCSDKHNKIHDYNVAKEWTSIVELINQDTIENLVIGWEE